MSEKLHKIEKHLWWLLPLLALLLYAPTWQSGFVHDFTGWFERYSKYGLSGLAHCFGYHRLQHVMHTAHFLIFKVFGTSPLPWYVIYAILFGINSYLVFKLSRSIIKFVGHSDRLFPVLAAVLFLVHPYATTAVVWKVCFHYLLATFFVLLALDYSLQWISNKSKSAMIKVFIFYVLGLFTHELVIALPIMGIIISSILFVSKNEIARKFLLYVVVPQLLFLPLYFSLRPLLLQDNGKDSVLSEHTIDPIKQATALYQYGGKHFLFSRYWSHASKEKFHFALSKPKIVYPLLIVSLILISLFYFYYRKLPGEIKIFGLSILLFSAAIAPFSSAYVYYILLTTNDMYGFSASVFAILSVVAFLRWLPRRIGNVLLILFFSLSIIFLLQTNYYWHESGHVMNSLMKDFRWYDKEKVYVLNSADNYRGLLMMKSHEASTLDDHLLVKDGKYPDCEIQDVMQFNMTKRSDGVSVIVHSSDSLSVKFNQWGTWHWRNGIGATSYENDDFKAKLKIPYYHLKIKNPDEDAVFIYQDGDKWKEVEFN